ncbi:MAG TPA: protein kinase [Kofleriaceae bacterium]|nr:protein kinase [Kofleriaceae bacterium]
MNPEEGAGAQPAADAPDPMVGQIIDGRYKVTRRLGEGGMGEVYAAEHVHIEKRVAIKLLRNEILANQEAVSRFRQEARSASSIGHKNIITIEDFGQLPDGRVYLAMEHLVGPGPLADLIRDGVPADRLVQILIQTGHGLAAAHKKGIVHRDMKPENIFVTSGPDGEDVPKLLDFGIAKISNADGNNHLTRTGTIFGTPFYMAPEQALGQGVDARADVYAMGVIMYEAFTGVVPFEGDSFMAILTQHITAEPKPPAQVAAAHGKVIPPGIEEIIVKAMRKEAPQRYQSMDELVQALVGVYRSIAGAGMSSYMQAHQVSGPGQTVARSAAMPTPGHQTPMPTGPAMGAATVMASPYGPPPVGPSTTPQPTHPSDQSSPYHQPYAPAAGSQPMGMPLTSSSGASAVDQSHAAPKKSKAGLFIVLFLVLAAAGGAAAFFVMQNKKKEEGAVAQGGGTVGKTTTDAGSGSVTPPPATADAGAGTVVPVKTPDAGATTKPPDTKPPDTKPPEVKVLVLVAAKPDRTEIYGADGKKLGEAPMNVSVDSGKPMQLTLKHRRHKDLKVTIDGSQKKVSYTLEKIEKPGPGPGKGPCAVDPKSQACRCKKNPKLPECELE